MTRNPAPLLAAGFGVHQVTVTDAMVLTYNGAAITFLLAGLLAAGLGFASFRQLDDRRGVPLRADLTASFHNEAMGLRGARTRRGFLVALEGGEGVGKSTQASRLAEWLEALGHDVVVTHEPGGTELGRRLRAVLLDHPDTSDTPSLSPRAEALLFAADRAEHVASLIAPALALGHIVITDRYIDSSVAYQGAGRELAAGEVAKLSRWATDGLAPDLTVVLDMPAAAGLGRVEAPDRLESEPLAFHERVRDRFLEIARRGGSRYLVVDAGRSADEITAVVRARLEPVLPPSAAQLRELDLARQVEEEQRRLAEEVRRLEAARRRADAADEARRKDAEEQERRRLESAALEEHRRMAAIEAEAQARLVAIAEREQAAQAAALAAQRAHRAEERRRIRDEQRQAREEAHRRVAEKRGGRRDTSTARPTPDPTTLSNSTATTPTVRGPVDQPTRELSLTDELFGEGFGDDDSDRTVRLPRATDPRDDR